MRNAVKKLISRNGSVFVTLAISLPCIGGSVVIALIDIWLFGHDPVPLIYLAFITPALIAPPITYVLVLLVEELDQAEQTILEREERLSKESADREWTKAAFQESEKRFRNLIEGSIQGILIHRDHKPLFVNHTWAEIHGYTPEEILAMESVVSLVVPHDQDRVVWYNYSRLRGGEAPVAYEYQGQCKDGTLVWLDNRERVVSWDGEFATLSTLFDITIRKHSERILRDSEERHRSFAADAAHELRTPLAVLRSHVDSLEDSDATRSMRLDVDTMSRLVEQLLASSWLESLNVEQSNEADLHAVCTRVAAYMAPIAIKEERSIEVTGCDCPVMVMGNADALEQAVRNLVENAIRYSARRTTVTIDVNRDATIRVIDRGRGVPAEMRNKVFTRFMRADRRTGGAGLGLSIVQRTVEAHDGTIEVGENPGGGVIFIMRLPSAAPSAASSPAEAVSVPTSAAKENAVAGH